ncbi:MAG: aminodeoxychorismate synthase component I [Bacteroidota bacterium]
MDKNNTTSISKHGGVSDRAFLFSALRTPNTILLESSRRDALNRNNYLFHSPTDVLTVHSLKDVPTAFDAIERHLAQGKWIAGYVGYESGYHFENIVRDFDNRTSLPLMWLGVYDPPLIVPQEFLEIELSSPNATIFNPRLSISVSTYFHTIDRLKKYILNGDTYQINFTDRFEFIFSGDEFELYLLLRQKQHVPFSAFLNLNDVHILSFSPELFFRQNNEVLTVKPMKGTCHRGRTIKEDDELAEWLHNDEKNRSENLMIVDLLRNDLGRICTSGSVRVKELFAVERYETVLQMTSTIEGMLQNEISYYDIFKALFPCGSVTGAPKIRTMQIINETERHQRGVYCGAIGFIAPEKEATFSVAIRTVVLHNSKGTLGVGSGIVYDSDPAQEYEECALKAEFLLKDQERFEIFETMLWKERFLFLEQHLERMRQSAEYFFFTFNKEKILDMLKNAERTFQKEKEYRVRLSLSRSTIPHLDIAEVIPFHDSPVIKIAPEHTDSNNRFFYHKTTYRPLYNKYRQLALQDRIADYIFLNEREEVTEGTITNIFVETNGKLFTPPISCGLLAGIYRNHILETRRQATERILTLNDLKTARHLYLCNSIRGWQHVRLSTE